MHIFFDHQIFALQRFGGISRYFIQLAENLDNHAENIRTTVVAPLYINSYLADSPVTTKGMQINEFRGKHHILPVVNRILSKNILKKVKPDIFHETYYTAHYQQVRAPRFLTVYDMIHERFPELFTGIEERVPKEKAEAAHRADHIITISNSTRDDVIRYLNIPENKIAVIPLASSFQVDEKLLRNSDSHRPYLLYVGLRQGVKNFSTLFKAYSQSNQLRTHFDLLCAGGGAFTPREKQAISDAGLQDRLHHRMVSDETLASFYANATLLIYPSLYEGFGIPLLEAMSCGCPIVCSNTSSMPEIAGDAAMYCNPEEEEEMRSLLESVSESVEIQERLREAGYRRHKLYSWKRSADQTVQLYRSLL